MGKTGCICNFKFEKKIIVGAFTIKRYQEMKTFIQEHDIFLSLFT